MPSVGSLELVVTLAILAIYAIPIAIVAVLIRRRRSPTNEPIDVLRIRLARGELDESEYQRLLTVLRSR